MPEISFQIKIGNIRIGTIQNASSFNIGKNYLREFKSLSKTNQGLGSILGDHNQLPGSTNYVEDPDGLDIWCGAREELQGELQGLLELLGPAKGGEGDPWTSGSG
ncbi:MAG: hypothetical protein QHH75_07315 [Bacillota bacterium]|nr:hypothetical protein [Bacillota bacterium]